MGSTAVILTSLAKNDLKADMPTPGSLRWGILRLDLGYKNEEAKLTGRLAKIDNLSQPIESVMSIIETLKTKTGKSASTDQLNQQVNDITQKAQAIPDRLVKLIEEYNAFINLRSERVKNLFSSVNDKKDSTLITSEQKSLDSKFAELNKRTRDLEVNYHQTKKDLNDLYGRIYSSIPPHLLANVPKTPTPTVNNDESNVNKL